MSKLGEIVENREAWRTTVHGVTKSQTRLELTEQQNCRVKDEVLVIARTRVLSGVNENFTLFLIPNPCMCTRTYVPSCRTHTHAHIHTHTHTHTPTEFSFQFSYCPRVYKI